MPPPYYYEYQIHLTSSGAADINLIPGYASQGVATWTETFSIPAEQVNALYHRMVQLGLLATSWRADAHASIGASSEALTVRVQGRKIELPFFIAPEHAAHANEMYAAMRALVPQILWDKLKLLLQVYIQKPQ